MHESLLSIKNLRVAYGANQAVLKNINIDIPYNQHIALIGCSGAGKSTLGYAICCAALSPRARDKRSHQFNVQRIGKIRAGTIALHGRHHAHNRARNHQQHARIPSVGMIFQYPHDSLNPSLTIGEIFHEQCRIVYPNRRRQHTAIIARALRRFGITPDDAPFHRYPHEFSRGMCQRVVIALNALLRPPLLIADEPTSALDSENENQIISHLNTIPYPHSLLLITHNIKLAQKLCQRILILDDGEIVDDISLGTKTNLITNAHAQQFLNAADTIEKTEAIVRVVSHNPPRDTAQSLVALHNISFTYKSGLFVGAAVQPHTIFHNASLTIAPGAAIGLYGSSGAGKSTLLRLISLLLTADSGSYFFAGKNVNTLSGIELRKLRTKIALIFQDPSQALSPLLTVRQIIGEPMRIQKKLTHTRNDRHIINKHILQLMDEVGLSSGILDRKPLQLSGGQQQRVLIARVLSVSPQILLADEPFSALDTVVQARLIALIQQLQRERALGFLLVSHRIEFIKALTTDHFQLINRAIMRKAIA